MAVSREAICRKYNFKDIRVATWRDPYSVYNARAPGQGVVSPDAYQRPYIPRYRLIIPNAKLPQATDDEDSDPGDVRVEGVPVAVPVDGAEPTPEGQSRSS